MTCKEITPDGGDITPYALPIRRACNWLDLFGTINWGAFPAGSMGAVFEVSSSLSLSVDYLRQFEESLTRWGFKVSVWDSKVCIEPDRRLKAQ